MSAVPTDFETVLREALSKATASAPQAHEDLLGLTAEASEAVSKVTGGAAILELAPLDVGDDPRPTYQLQLRKDKSQAPATDFGVFRVSVTGYPIHRWQSRRNWEARPDAPDNEHLNVDYLKENFSWMLSRPDSKLVVLVNYLRQANASGV